MAPIAAATEALATDRVEEGFAALAADALRSGLDQGVREIAAIVSARPAAVTRLLPMSEIEAILARIAASQPKAATAWGAHAGGLLGLSGRPSAAPGGGPAPAASERIRALADTMQRDKMVSEPLHALAADVAQWEALVPKLVEIVATSPALRRAARIKAGKRIAAAIVAAAIVAAITTVAIVLRNARARVQAAVLAPDPCVAFEISPTDLERVSSELRAEAEEQKRACEAAREARAAAARAEAERKAKEEAERKAKEAYEVSCEALAKGVEAGTLRPEDEAFANDAGLTARVAKGAIEGRDFGPDDPAMPCKGTKSEAKLWEAYQKAALAKPWLLLQALAPSPRARDALATGSTRIAFPMKRTIARRANDLAKFAVKTGKTEDGARAAAWCEVARALGMPMAGPCDAADKIAKGK